MKKGIIILLLLVLITGCGKKEEKKEIKKTKTLYTCMDKYETFYFYYDSLEEPYYRATYLMDYEFNTEKEANSMNQILLDDWNNNYINSNMEIEVKTEYKTTYLSVVAHNDAIEEKYKEYFGDRYNLPAKELNETFNNKCYIKSI